MADNTVLKALVDAHGAMSRDLFTLDQMIRNDKSLKESEKAARLDKLWQAWQDSSENLVKARNGIFDQNSPEIRGLVTELADAQDQLEDAIKARAKTMQVLGAMIKIVDIVKRLVALL